MEKEVIMDAYNKGLISEEECAKILGIDPNLLMHHHEGNLGRIYEGYTS